MELVDCFDVSGFPLVCGTQTPDGFYVAYRTFGALNEAADNAILYCTSLASHDQAKLMIGPGMLLDSTM